MNWVEGFTISTRIDAGAMTISANREGLLSLANCLIELAEGAPGSHRRYRLSATPLYGAVLVGTNSEVQGFDIIEVYYFVVRGTRCEVRE